jgi:hypothetical protein
MKKIIGITAVLVVGLFFTAFSQSKKPDLKKEFPKDGYLKDTLDTGKFRFNPADSVIILTPGLERNLSVPGLDDPYFYFKPDSSIAVHSLVQDQYRMPVYKPQGNYPMPIHVPDSTVNYTLRIKAIK